MAKMGRPLKTIDWDLADRLCALHCTKAEIASALKISEDTLEKALKRVKKTTFTAYFEQKSAPGKISLRRKQYEMAMAGDRTLLIWVGKQWLGQSEKQEIKQTIAASVNTQNIDNLTEEEITDLYRKKISGC